MPGAFTLDNIFTYEYIVIQKERMKAVNEGLKAYSMIARRLKAMADPSRIAIIHKLCGGERNVSELVRETGLSQANVSKHLRILREEELVDFRRVRRMVYYRLASEMPREVCDRICRSLESGMAAGKGLLEEYRRIANE